MGGFPLFTTHLRAKYGPKYGAKIWGQNFLWESKGAPPPYLKEKTAHMECTRWHVGLRAGALSGSP
jgi:hypothetical protein